MNVYKITPVSCYDIRGTESWLENMARRGLFLKKLRSGISTFQRGSSRSVRYRLEPCRRGDSGEPTQTMRELYQDFGWTFVCSLYNEMLVFSTQDLEAREPHSDAALQGELWKRLYRAKRREFWWKLFALIFFVCLLTRVFLAGSPIYNLITTILPLAILEVPLLLVMLTQTRANVRQLALVVRQLEEGVPLDHRNIYLSHQWGHALSYLLLCLLLLGIIFSNLVLPLTGGDIRPLEELTVFPPLSLAQIEGDVFEPGVFYGPDLPQLPKDILSYIDYGNFCRIKHYPLCWNQWEVVQTGSIQPEDWRRLEIQWYDLPAPLSFLSVPLARELMDGAMGLNRDIWWTSEAQDQVWTVNYYPQEEGALLATASSGPDGFQIAAAALGNKAAVVQYTGMGDLADHLDEIMAMVQ